MKKVVVAALLLSILFAVISAVDVTRLSVGDKQRAERGSGQTDFTPPDTQSLATHNTIDAAEPSVTQSPECLTLTEYLNNEDAIAVDKFIRENMLQPNSVDAYLTELSEEDLLLEVRAGSREALYVLGINKHWSAHRSVWTNPAANLTSPLGIPKPLNLQTLREARAYLWQAALHGISIALAELGSTFDTQIKMSRLTTAEEERLVTQNYLYRRLSISVAPDVARFYSLTTDDLDDEFRFLAPSERDRQYAELFEQWKADRRSLGKASTMEFTIPESIQHAWDKEFNVCDEETQTEAK